MKCYKSCVISFLSPLIANTSGDILDYILGFISSGTDSNSWTMLSNTDESKRVSLIIDFFSPIEDNYYDII